MPSLLAAGCCPRKLTPLGCWGHPRQQGRSKGTYSGACFARTSTGTRRSNGARDSIRAIFARGTNGARRTLQAGERGGREQSSANGRSGVAGAGYVAVLSTSHSVPMSAFLSHRPQTGFTLPCLPKLLFVLPVPGSSLHVHPTCDLRCSPGHSHTEPVLPPLQ